METSISTIDREEGDDDKLELPPGFRFHPTDEELISDYLSPKVLDSCFLAKAVGEVDLNKCEPWELPWLAKMGEKEWYFFCVRDRKYPTGSRTNRATSSGYWKATGKDREIYKGKTLVGMKKTLVFYKGRAPKGEKTNWVMHEFRLEGKISLYNLPKTARNEWAICRVFEKNSGGKKTHTSNINLSYNGNSSSSHHVSCFFNSMEDNKSQMDNIIIDSFNNSLLTSSSSGTLQYSNHHQSPLTFSSENNDQSIKLSSRENSLVSNSNNELVVDPSSFFEPLDLDCLWNY